jgi:protein-S-isoprenylcysteine O-methyltransferase Ste14
MHVAAVAIAGPVSTVRGAAGAVLYTLALGLFWWAVRANRNAPLSAVFSPDAPAHLTRTGPYRSIRHPFYSSYLLAWTAGPVATNQWWLIPTVLFMLAVYIHASDVEERKFESSGLADDYRSYRAQTGRFVPNLFKLLARRTR